MQCEHSQFGRPSGWRGALIGHLMAVKNRGLNRAAVGALDPASDDIVLEVGCGPGTNLVDLAARARRVVAVDPSGVMVGQARRRVARSGLTPRVDVLPAVVEDLPLPDGSIDVAFEVNTLHHWSNVERGLAELHRVLLPDGRLQLTLRIAPSRPRPWVAPGHTLEEIDAIAPRVAAAGFEPLARVRISAGREAVCLQFRRC